MCLCLPFCQKALGFASSSRRNCIYCTQNFQRANKGLKYANRISNHYGCVAQPRLRCRKICCHGSLGSARALKGSIHAACPSGSGQVIPANLCCHRGTHPFIVFGPRLQTGLQPLFCRAVRWCLFRSIIWIKSDHLKVATASFQ